VRRREFITLLGGAAAWPLAARAQQAGKLPTVGFLGASKPSAWSDWVAAFEQRLRQLGWIEGRTVAIEYRWAEGRSERYAEIAAEFVRLKVDIIVTAGGAVPAVKQATSAIPIVFAVANNPIGAGLVASLSRPGGNVTGLSVQAPDLVGKRLELLQQVLPSLRGLAIMANAGYPAAVHEMGEVEATAGTLGLKITRSEIRQAEDIAPAIEALKGRADLVKLGRIRTMLIVPMLSNDTVIGAITVSRTRVQPFTEKEIEMVADFAAQATIALETTRRERQYREVQMQLAHANRVATIGQLSG
jgi:putative tryptophan/tyrosine transport system substrate-binding protein